MTRKEYLDTSYKNPGAHRAYYAQFVNAHVRGLVSRFIGEDELAKSTDEHLNDIPLSRWDKIVSAGLIPGSVAKGMREQGDYLTLGSGVCVLKEAARQIIESKARVSA